MNFLKTYNKATKWIKNYTLPWKGISVSSLNKNPYPEASGYFIPTFLNWGMRDLAVQYTQWLCSIQKENGSWHDSDDKDPYIFDTAQILKGLLAISDIVPEVQTNIIKGCDWLLSNVNEKGQLVAPSEAHCAFDNKMCNELIHIYCLAPLIDAGNKYNRPLYIQQAKRILEYYKSARINDILDFNILSHFYAYIIEGLIDLGETELVKQAMEKVSLLQKKNGSIPAYKKVKWICSTGLFQFALIYYKLGEKDRGDRAFKYAVSLQNKSGAWFGGYPVNWLLFFLARKHRPNYFRNAEISWAVKYFLDAFQYKLLVGFEDMAPLFLKSIDANDGRYLLVKDTIKKHVHFVNTPKKILDAGCGTGRYLINLLQEDLEGIEWSGCDLSLKVMTTLPKEIATKQGSLLNLPYPTGYFDFVYTCEALEHSVNLDGALAELIRVVKKGGHLLIIDKDIKKSGRLRIAEWEQWFDIELKNKLEVLGCSVAVFDNIPYENKSDGLFCGWLAEKG
jgi:malonyl-CoA O-methyltransferase